MTLHDTHNSNNYLCWHILHSNLHHHSCTEHCLSDHDIIHQPLGDEFLGHNSPHDSNCTQSNVLRLHQMNSSPLHHKRNQQCLFHRCNGHFQPALHNHNLKIGVKYILMLYKMHCITSFSIITTTVVHQITLNNSFKKRLLNLFFITFLTLLEFKMRCLENRVIRALTRFQLWDLLA